MFKACSRCGRIHDINQKCRVGKVWKQYNTEQRKLRATTAWRNKSIEIRARANNLCEVCRDSGIYTYDNLEVHHIVKIRDDKESLLNNFNLICLCSMHHKLADAGQIDTEYLKTLAMQREGKETPVPFEGYSS